MCPSGPAHTISSGGAGCVRAVPLTLSVLGELGVPGRSPSCCGLSFQACRYGHVQHLEHLLFYGADMGAQNASGNTALHICALYNQVSSRDCAPGPGLCSALCGRETVGTETRMDFPGQNGTCMLLCFCGLEKSEVCVTVWGGSQYKIACA